MVFEDADYGLLSHFCNIIVMLQTLRLPKSQPNNSVVLVIGGFSEDYGRMN